MQRPNPKKRLQILAAAARLFAARPYHEVTLDAVAALAKVGKGTLYVYFSNKEALYAALLEDGFERLVADLEPQLATKGLAARDGLGLVIDALLQHAERFPHLFHLMRTGEQLPCADRLADHRARLMKLVEDILRRGIQRGELRDSHPHLTAAYLPSLVRAAVLYGPSDLPRGTVASHILEVLCSGIEHRPAAQNNRSKRTSKRTPRKPR
jgi:AcrR family transcriptional regulator